MEEGGKVWATMIKFQSQCYFLQPSRWSSLPFRCLIEFTRKLKTASSNIVTEFMSQKGYFVPTQHKLGCIFSIS